MARGLGGDDGPSIFMAVACVLIWNKISSMMSKTGDEISRVAKKNYANPIQSESTTEIEQMEAWVKAIPVAWSSLPKPRTVYSAIAQRQWSELTSSFNVNEDKLFGDVEHLNANELRAVAKYFGVKDKTAIGVAVWTGHIVKAYETYLDNNFLSGDELGRMKKIWAKAGLWY
jgi:hypothetical protein